MASSIAFRVAPSLGRWTLLHNSQPMATFDTQEAAEMAALAVAVLRPASKTARIETEGAQTPLKTITSSDRSRYSRRSTVSVTRLPILPARKSALMATGS